MMLSRRTLVAVVVALVALSAGGAADAHAARAKLVAFDSCRGLLSYARTNAARAGEGVGVPLRAVPDVAPLATEKSPAAAAPQERTADAGAGAPAFSGTNVQEAGVDEPDVVKTDGRMIYTLSGDVLRVTDASDPAAPRVVGTLAVPHADQLLLRGTRVLAIGTQYAFYGRPIPLVRTATVLPAGGNTTTVLTEVDASNPAAPRIARTMTLPGTFVDARQVGGTARVVVSSTPEPVGAKPLSRAPLRAFVPATTIASKITRKTYRRGVVPCGAIRRPDQFSGLGLLTVLTVDLDKGLYDVDRDAILAGAQTVYGSATSLYVASQRYVPNLDDAGDVPPALRTEIHRFDASKPGVTTYAGTGTVPGFVVNNYALSEQDGALRVASTDEPAWLAEGRDPDPAQSYVTVLKPNTTGALAQVGQVGGLGKGQRIYGVRFAGTVGYVVTFRQMDPLYTIDLTDPAAPRVVGQLDIPGYSAYLHPLGDGLLLGVGQEATDQGRPLGTQVSVFDVSDLAHPRRVQHVVYGDGSSDAEFDPHAFLYWAPSKLVVLPLTTASFTGAVGLHADASQLAEAGRIAHPTQDGEVAPIARSLVIGDELYTLSAEGLGVNRVDTLAPVAFASFR